MRRWNGWGDESNKMDLPASGSEFLRDLVGEGSPLGDVDLQSVMGKVPASRLPEHKLITQDAEERVRHARGQSLPDWLAMRNGDYGYFPDGVAFPETKDQVAELVNFCHA